MTVWVVRVTTESCDSYGPWVFAKRPKKWELDVFLKRELGDEFDHINYVEGPFKREVVQ